MFDACAEFLTFEDLLECARKTANEMGARNATFNKNSVQTWLRSGVLGDSSKPSRVTRNRLYSTVDVIRLAAIMALVHLGLRALDAANIAKEIVHAVGTDWLNRAELLEAIPELDARDLIYVVPGEKEGVVAIYGVSPESTKEFANKEFLLNLYRFGVATVVDARFLVHVATAITVEKHKAKLLQWRDRLKAELAKAQKKKG